MKKYFGSAICSKGYLSAYNTIYKNDPTARVFLINGGDDFERAVFFDRLIKNLRGYNITLFNPFYDETADGIYIENLNTYILSDGGYNRISPLLSGGWEKSFAVVSNKDYPLDLRREILTLKAKENNHYKNACETLKNASSVREKIHGEVAEFLNDDKLINYINRFCSRYLRNAKKKNDNKIRLLSSFTPLGLHTHYNTLFEHTEKTVEFNDNWGFAGSVFLGVLKDWALRERVPVIISPAYFSNDIPHILIFPTIDLSVIVTDDSHKLPFTPAEKVTATRFLTDENVLKLEKINALISVENKLFDNAVLSLYEGRDCRFKYNNLLKGYSNTDEAVANADKLTQKILN